MSTAIAVEMTPSPRSSPVMRRVNRFAAERLSTYVRSRMSPTIGGLLGLGEEAHGLDEGDGQEDHAGQQRGHRHRDPHLLPTSLDHLDELAVDVAPDAPGLLADEAAEVAGLAVEREDR